MLVASLAALPGQPGLTLRRYSNTALAGAAPASVLASLESIPGCDGASCGTPSSLLLTGRVAPPAAGNYGFNVTFDPPLPYPSADAYARLWVHDHLLFPLSTPEAVGKPRAGDHVPLWIPLPPRALDAQWNTIEHAGAANISSYEVRFEYVCLAAAGCGERRITLRWATFASDAAAPPPAYDPIPLAALQPTQSSQEATRRALYSRLQRGWGTHYHPGMLTWVLLPESFAVKLGLLRLSSGAFLSPEGSTSHSIVAQRSNREEPLWRPYDTLCDEGLTINPSLLHAFAVRAGLHSYNRSYIQREPNPHPPAPARAACCSGGWLLACRYAGASLTWRAEGNLNVSIETTVDDADSSQLTMLVSVNGPTQVNASDYLLVVLPSFTHGRAGRVRRARAEPCAALADREAEASVAARRMSRRPLVRTFPEMAGLGGRARRHGRRRGAARHHAVAAARGAMRRATGGGAARRADAGRVAARAARRAEHRRDA
jgi:hypothetical protein